MIEREIIIRKLSSLSEYYTDLETARKELNWETFLSDKVVRRYVERTLHIAIEACLDIANHIISYEGYREPKSNQDTFQVLIEEGIFDKDFGQRMMKMAQFRNVIVHDYIKIQPEIVYAVLQKQLKDLSQFANTMRRVYL
ncbi:type VII toxin-antitoxin system HepT family RNase toxin [Desulfitibacter alkalitolerans]|uniref:type VII toxin-antitoxin system HepT family RNase toxin n=1 Tax=Desulfitibacter alkalitolerans TaxID=264641 RepID=UPI000484539E|nr:DUF86 domain-containing protein [Desulfitibacter alkalitolerans]